MAEDEVMPVEDFAEQLLRVSGEMKSLAIDYKNARSTYAKCFNRITILIYKATRLKYGYQ